ncbi:MAG: hypothetical protein EBY39_13440, partial [Flavobacteriia bacterium]|nr:hypothetical protein [Flavobacteriia bacterium]
MALNQVYLIKSGDGLFREENQALFGIADGKIGIGTNSPTDDFQVVGSTRLNSLSIDDNKIVIADNQSSESYINGGGIVLRGASDKNIVWAQGINSWHINENITLSSSKKLTLDSIRALDSDGVSLFEKDGVKGLSVLNNGNVNITDNLTVQDRLYVNDQLHADGGLTTTGIIAHELGTVFQNHEGQAVFTILGGAGVVFNAIVRMQGTLSVDQLFSAHGDIETDQINARSSVGLNLYDDENNGLSILDGGDVESSHDFTIKGSLDVGVDSLIQNNLTVDGYIETDKLRARSDAGLLLQDDGGNGITISDGGNVEASHNLKVKGNSEFNGAISYFDSNFVHVLRPESSFYKSGNGTGYIKIKLPQSWTSNFLSFDVQVYQNIGDQNSQSFTLKVGGNNDNQSDSWQNVYAQLISSNTDQNFNVRFGHDGDKCAIYIGESNSSWSSPLINLYNFSASYSDSSSTADHWNDGWEVSIVSSLGAISKTSEAG